MRLLWNYMFRRLPFADNQAAWQSRDAPCRLAVHVSCTWPLDALWGAAHAQGGSRMTVLQQPRVLLLCLLPGIISHSYAAAC